MNVKRSPSIGLLLTMLGLTATAACGDDVPATSESATGTSTGTVDPTTTTGQPPTTTDPDTTAGESSSSGDPGSTTEEGESSSSGSPPLPPPMPADFVVTIENVSNTGLMFSPMSPGLWANHEANADVFFEQDVVDPGDGLEQLAEDGDPSALLPVVEGNNGVDQAGIFNTPVGAGGPGPLLPGDVYEFTFTAEPATRVSLALMLVGSNDYIISTSPVGLSLFAGGGQVLGERDVSSNLRLYDSGTEINQAPGQGPMQALHGGSPDMGPSEAPGVYPYNYSTRAIPLGPDLMEVEVADDPKAPGTFIVTLTNISMDRGTLVTPFSDLVWATHTDAIGLFADGAAASPEIEALAEDGVSGPMDMLLMGSAEVGEHAVIPGPILPGDSVEFTFTPDAAFPRFSLATMVVQSNDAFLAVNPEGVTMFDNGALRQNGAIEDDIVAALTPWDAGTEANEVPGRGDNQVLQQGGALDVGPVETDNPTVHRYADVNNDLAGDSAGGVLDVTVGENGGDYTITITNSSGGTPFPAIVTPTVWAVHDDTVSLFEVGMPASPGLELLAEDGDPAGVLGDLMGMGGVSMSGVVNTSEPPNPAMGPIGPGQAYEFTVTPSGANRFLSFATMIVPSNDTFASLDPGGVALLTAGGATRPAATVAAEIAAALGAWDAGTEGNQAGAAGRDMAPTGAPNTGPSNGNGLVREADEDEIWSIPAAEGLIRVIIAPVEKEK